LDASDDVDQGKRVGCPCGRSRPGLNAVEAGLVAKQDVLRAFVVRAFVVRAFVVRAG